MKLNNELMYKVAKNELQLHEAFKLQEELDKNTIIIENSKIIVNALALVPQVIINNGIGRSLVALCAKNGIKLTLKECYQDYKNNINSNSNVITWGVKLRHEEYLANNRNILFVENGLLCQRHGCYIDDQGYFANSSIAINKEYSTDPSDEDINKLQVHLKKEFNFEFGVTSFNKNGPILVVLQTPNDAPLQYYCSHIGDGIQYVIDSASEYLPKDINVILRPHPRHNFIAQNYRIPDEWTVQRDGNVYNLLKDCSAVVTANSTLGIEALALQMPVAFLGRHIYSGSDAGLECDGKPELLKTILQFIPSKTIITRLLCSILKRQYRYHSSLEELEQSISIKNWIQRCLSIKKTTFETTINKFMSASVRIRSRNDIVLQDLLLATENQLKICKPCVKERYMNNIVGMDKNAFISDPVFTPDLLEKLSVAGMKIKVPDLLNYTDKLYEIQKQCNVRISLTNKDVVLGFLYAGHLGDTLCTTPLRTGLQSQGHNVKVVRHRNTIACFEGHGIEQQNKGRIRLGPPSDIGGGHIIQRLQRWFGQPEQLYPRPDIILSNDEIIWATKYCEGMRRPLILVSTGAESNVEGYKEMPWNEWGKVLSEYGTVLQCVVGTEPTMDSATIVKGITVRQWFSLFSRAQAYVGTWAAGIHAAAAFGLETLVVCHDPIKVDDLSFPLPAAHILTFLYPQHIYGEVKNDHI